MDVGGWLRGLGLGQYEAVFRDNAIDADVLPSSPMMISRSSDCRSATENDCSTRSPALSGTLGRDQVGTSPRSRLTRLPPSAARSR